MLMGDGETTEMGLECLEKVGLKDTAHSGFVKQLGSQTRQFAALLAPGQYRTGCLWDCPSWLVLS